MKKQGKIMTLIEKGTKFVDEHQREIMLGSAIAGTILTAVASWKAGIKADKILTAQREKMDALKADFEAEDIGMTEEEFNEKKKEITIDTVKQMAPVVAPVALSASGTIISVVGGYKVASKQIATLSALYSMAEKSLGDYQDKAKEFLGDKKAGELHDKVKEGKILDNPPSETDTIINTGKGTTLCLDDWSGRYFYSSPEEIRKSFNIINKRMMDEYYISLNELYDELGLPDIKLGEDIGFNIDDGLIDIDHLFTAALHNGSTPILSLDYDVSPKYSEHRGKMFR